MERKETEHFLKVLVELDLFPVVEILEETDLSKDKINKEQQASIIDFINKLPPEYKNMTNRDTVIAKTLKKLGVETQWGEKKMQEQTLKKNTPTNKTDKINNDYEER